MPKDTPQDIAAEERADQDVADVAEELSDEALEQVTGGFVPYKNPTSPFGIE